MTSDWMDEYRGTDDVHRRYQLLRQEMTRLRRNRELFDPDAVAETIRGLSDSVAGDLVVFVANDFGLPLAYRPAGVDQQVQDEIRQEILSEKYKSAEDLNRLREELSQAHPAVHKALVCERTDDTIRYHLPGGRREDTNFLTVREAVGLVDYTTNSDQAPDQSRTYRSRS